MDLRFGPLFQPFLQAQPDASSGQGSFLAKTLEGTENSRVQASRARRQAGREARPTAFFRWPDTLFAGDNLSTVA